MTVRVNKQPFNIREKLSELERPIGVKGSELMRSETAQEAGSALGVGRRNLCVNGNFKIWQRGTSVTASGNSYKYITADRWQTYFGSNAYSRQDVVLPNGEKVYAFRETIGGTRLYFDHVIEEGGRIFNQGGDITVSFWARTSGPLTGVALGFYWHSGGNFAGGTYTFSTIRESVIIEGSEWKHYTLTVTLPKNSDNRPHLAIEFDNNSSYGDWQQISGSDYWEFANIQIEKGKLATEFEQRSYGEELALCQRYYQKVTSSNYIYDHCVFHYGSSFYASHTFMQPMRSSPNITISTNGSYYEAGSAHSHGQITIRNTTPEALNFYALTGGGTNGYAGGVYFSYTADAEL